MLLLWAHMGGGDAAVVTPSLLYIPEASKGTLISYVRGVRGGGGADATRTFGCYRSEVGVVPSTYVN